MNTTPTSNGSSHTWLPRRLRHSGPGDTSPAEQGRVLRWVQRLGVAGFAFFLIKGLLWLIVPALLAYWGTR